MGMPFTLPIIFILFMDLLKINVMSVSTPNIVEMTLLASGGGSVSCNPTRSWRSYLLMRWITFVQHVSYTSTTYCLSLARQEQLVKSWSRTKFFPKCPNSREESRQRHHKIIHVIVVMECLTIMVCNRENYQFTCTCNY